MDEMAVIGEIREAEKQSKGMVEEAQKNAEAIINNAQEESRKIIADAGLEGAHLREEIIKKARKRGEKLARDIEEKSAKELGLLKSRALKRSTDAEKKVCMLLEEVSWL